MSLGPRKARFAATLERLRDEVRHRAGGTDLLPGERALSAHLSVSRTTLRRMLTLLVDEGMLVHRQGIGTFVRAGQSDRPPAPNERAAIAGFTEAVRRLGGTVSSDAVDLRHRPPTPHEAMLLGCCADDRVFRVSRLRRIDGEVAARECAVLPNWALVESADLRGSLYEALAAGGTMPVRSSQRMRVGLGTTSELTAIGVAAPHAVVRLRRLDYVGDGRCCAYTETVLRADRFDLLVDVHEGVPPLGLSLPDDGMRQSMSNHSPRLSSEIAISADR